MEAISATLAPVHGANNNHVVCIPPCQGQDNDNDHQRAVLPGLQVALLQQQPETGEQEVVCVVSRDDSVSVERSQQVDLENDLDSSSQTHEHYAAGCTDALLPEQQQQQPQNEEVLYAQTLPDVVPASLPAECPPYVDIRSPADGLDPSTAAAAAHPTLGQSSSTPRLARSPVRGGCGGSNLTLGQGTSLLGDGYSPSVTPGQCTPLLGPKSSEHLAASLGLPPVVIHGALPAGVANALAAEKSETSSAIIAICRICHMPEEDEDEMLISPCRCAGTLQFIHNTCLQRWLEISAKKSRKPPKCELCHYQYHRHKKFKFHHWRFPRVSRQDKILHIVFVFNLVIMISCAIATVMCFLSDKGQITKFPRNKVDLTTEEIITLSCGVLFFVSFFIAMSVQIKAKHTIYQLFVKFIMQNMEWEIDEYDKSKDAMFATKQSKPAFV